MKKISGNKLLVKALKEEGVDILLDIREPVQLISVMKYTNRITQKLYFRVMNRHLSMLQTLTPDQQEKSGYVW